MSFAESFAIIYFNMAGEMVYIIDQRLTAQAVEPTKANKVLNDITLAMFNSKLISEVFKPHNTITFALLRSVFEKLAHSSIMRLNEQSMNKLFDLMVMVVKYQLVSCSKPSDLLLITDNHLASLQEMVGGGGGSGEAESGFPETAELVGTVRSQFLFHYQNRYDLLQLQLIRYYLLNLLKDIHTRVSIFLREGVQSADGRFTIPTDKVVVECECLIPGQIRYFSTSPAAVASAAAAAAATVATKAVEGEGGTGVEGTGNGSVSSSGHAAGSGPALAATVERTEHFEVGAQFVVNEQRTTLGLNIYRKEAAREEQEAASACEKDADDEPHLQSANLGAGRNTTNEIDLLAMLICKAPSTTTTSSSSAAADANGQPGQTASDNQFKFEFLEDHQDSPSLAKLFKNKQDSGQHHHFEASSQQHLLDIIADLSSLDVVDAGAGTGADEVGSKVKESDGVQAQEEDDVDYLQLMDS